jgi:hypothetical protein
LNNLIRCISAAYGISLSAENHKTKMVETRLLQCLGWNACESKEARIKGRQSSSSGPGDDDEGITPQPSHRGPWQREEGKPVPPVRLLAKLNQCAIDLATAGSGRIRLHFTDFVVHRWMPQPWRRQCGLVLGSRLDWER